MQNTHSMKIILFHLLILSYSFSSIIFADSDGPGGSLPQGAPGFELERAKRRMQTARPGKAGQESETRGMQNNSWNAAPALRNEANSAPFLTQLRVYCCRHVTFIQLGALARPWLVSCPEFNSSLNSILR